MAFRCTSPDHVNALFGVLATMPEAAGQVAMCLDSGHANLCACTRNDYLGFMDRLGDHVPIIHWHAHENWGDWDSHLPLEATRVREVRRSGAVAAATGHPGPNQTAAPATVGSGVSLSGVSRRTEPRAAPNQGGMTGVVRHQSLAAPVRYALLFRRPDLERVAGPVDAGSSLTRSPDRPNPIGPHRVQVLEISESLRLRVEPLEAIDGTPVIDIKSVFPGVIDA